MYLRRSLSAESLADLSAVGANERGYPPEAVQVHVFGADAKCAGTIDEAADGSCQPGRIGEDVVVEHHIQRETADPFESEGHDLGNVRDDESSAAVGGRIKGKQGCSWIEWHIECGQKNCTLSGRKG